MVAMETQDVSVFQRIAQLEADRPFAWELECKGLLCGMFHALLIRHRQALSDGCTHTDAEL